MTCKDNHDQPVRRLLLTQTNRWIHEFNFPIIIIIHHSSFIIHQHHSSFIIHHHHHLTSCYLFILLDGFSNSFLSHFSDFSVTLSGILFKHQILMPFWHSDKEISLPPFYHLVTILAGPKSMISSWPPPTLSDNVTEYDVFFYGIPLYS